MGIIPERHRSRSGRTFVGGFRVGLTKALLLLSAVGAASTQVPRSGPAAMSVESWREDLEIMTGLLTQLHADAFHTVSRPGFEAERGRLSAAIPDLEDYEIIVAMTSLVASIGDGHTRLNLRPGAPGVPTDARAGFTRLPLRLEWFTDGVFVVSAATNLEPLVGARVVELGNVPVEEAIDRVLPVVHHDNEMTGRLLLPGFLTMPAVLRARGVVDGPGPVRIAVEQADGRRVERLVDVSPEADAGEARVLAASGVETPWWLQSRGLPYWLESVPASRAVYVQLNASRQHDDEPMVAFVDRLRRLLDSEDVERVVVDLRRNDGGDSELTRPLLALLAGWEGASPDHGLFVLIGRATFSAAVVLAAEFERYTGAVIMGEPTGGRPNQYGEIETFQLPHSGLTVSYSSWHFQTSDPWDVRPWVTPDVTVPSRFGDFAAGRDRALETAFSYDWRTPGLDATLIRVAREEGVDAALATYRRFRASPGHQYSDTEEALTELVIDFWRRDQVAASLPVALLVVDEYPNSFEAHENVAEVYADQGDVPGAVQHAIESLRLNPRNGDALGVLRDVCGNQVLTAALTSDLGTDGGRTALEEICDRGKGR